jgi:hypothetical protein
MQDKSRTALHQPIARLAFAEQEFPALRQSSAPTIMPAQFAHDRL